MKVMIQFIMLLMGWGLILLGIFFPFIIEFTIQQALGITCFSIAVGISIGRM